MQNITNVNIELILTAFTVCASFFVPVFVALLNTERIDLMQFKIKRLNNSYDLFQNLINKYNGISLLVKEELEDKKEEIVYCYLYGVKPEKNKFEAFDSVVNTLKSKYNNSQIKRILPYLDYKSDYLKVKKKTYAVWIMEWLLLIIVLIMSLFIVVLILFKLNTMDATIKNILTIQAILFILIIFNILTYRPIDDYNIAKKAESFLASKI